MFLGVFLSLSVSLDIRFKNPGDIKLNINTTVMTVPGKKTFLLMRSFLQKLVKHQLQQLVANQTPNQISKIRLFFFCPHTVKF